MRDQSRLVVTYNIDSQNWHRFMITSPFIADLHQIQDWVRDNTAGEKWISLIMLPNLGYRNYVVQIWFRAIRDAVLFKLCWGGNIG